MISANHIKLVEKSNFFGLTCNHLVKATLAAVLLLATRTDFVKADTNQFYFRSSCDGRTGIARIDAELASFGSHPAGYPYSVDNIPGAVNVDNAFSWRRQSEKPLFICDLGRRRDLAIKGFTGPVVHGATTRGIWIYVGTRLITHTFDFDAGSELVISRQPNDFFVEIRQCEHGQDCSSFLFTSPSYECSRVESGIAAGICTNNDLAALDVAVDETYEKVIAARPSLKNALVNDERRWLSLRSIRCVNSNQAADWRSQPFLLPAQAGCVKNLYQARLQVLQALQHER